MITILEKICQYHEILQQKWRQKLTDRTFFSIFKIDGMELTKGGILLPIRRYIRAVNALQ